MGNLVRDYVRTLPAPTCRQIVTDYEHFEKHGAIGTSALRTHAEKIAQVIMGDSGQVVLWMERLVFECLRRFTYDLFATEWTVNEVERMHDDPDYEPGEYPGPRF